MILINYVLFVGNLIFLFVMIGMFIQGGDLDSLGIGGLNLAGAILNLLEIIKANKK